MQIANLSKTKITLKATEDEINPMVINICHETEHVQKATAVFLPQIFLAWKHQKRDSKKMMGLLWKTAPSHSSAEYVIQKKNKLNSLSLSAIKQCHNFHVTNLTKWQNKELKERKSINTFQKVFELMLSRLSTNDYFQRWQPKVPTLSF